jgi:hypothetical protein
MRKLVRKLVLVAAGAALLALPPAAASRITVNTVEPTAEVSEQGRPAEVVVLLGCDRPQRARLRVTVTQSFEAARRAALAPRRRKIG